MASSSSTSPNDAFAPVPSLDSLIDRKAVDQVVTCTSLKCLRKHTQSLMQCFHTRLFDMPDTRNISWLVKFDSLPEPESLLILSPQITPKDFTAEDLALIKETGAIIGSYDMHIGFDQRPVEWLLAHYLPHISNITSSFEIVGHVAHMNLRGEDMLASKYIIGGITLEKHREIGMRTVVNKVGKVENEFRVLPMELIAGDPDTMVEVPESGCIFRFDFKDVFWNSRLQGEHTRIIRMMKSTDIVCDMFAGIGPFAIPLARKGIRTYANDLNPKSYEWMLSNAAANIGKRKQPFLSSYCLDGREFAKKMLQEEKIGATHVLMNLPMLAPEFCDVFVGLFPQGSVLPRVHVYCFGSGDTPEICEERVLERIQTALGGHVLQRPDLQVLKVRQTSTNTLEFCVSFTVPAEVGYMR